jgi:TM2 domain-containing membrane protein YozV
MGYDLVQRDQRSVGWAYALWIPGLFGFAGIHRIYSGRYLSGILWFFTGGLCGIGQFVDLIFIPRMVEDHNQGRQVW